MRSSSPGPPATASRVSASTRAARSLVLAAVVAAALAAPAAAHQGGYYWPKAAVRDWWQQGHHPMQPYGAYEGILIHFTFVGCGGIKAQAPGETSPAAIHKNGESWYKHYACAGVDRQGRVWNWVAHGHKYLLDFTALDCFKGGPGHPCPR